MSNEEFCSPGYLCKEEGILDGCSSCFAEKKSLPHLFLYDLLASEVWTYFARQFGLFPVMQSSIYPLLCSWLLSISEGSSEHVRMPLPVIILWSLWKVRNNSRFQGGRIYCHSGSVSSREAA